MPVSLSIKAVPDELVERLRRRAANNHRSLQRELMAIVEAAVHRQPLSATALASPFPTPVALMAAEPEAAWHVSAGADSDGLLEELDGIVAGSRWGEAALLARDQLHDRALAREIDFDARQIEVPSKAGAR